MTRHLPQADPMLRTLATLALASFAAFAIWLLVSSEGGSGPDRTPAGDAALPASIRVDGAVKATESGGSITRIVVPLALRGEGAIRLTEDGRLHATTLLADTASAAVPASYAVTWLDGNGDEVLDAGEHAVLTVDLPPGSSIKPGRPVDLIIRPAEGAPLTIEDVLS